MKYVLNIPMLFAVILLPVTVYFIFAVSPQEATMGESYRIFFIHVPAAICSVIWFAMSGIYAIIYLKNRKTITAIKFNSAAVIGFFLTILTTATGSVWAKIAWGSWWNWDPRQTSIVFLFLIYIAYFALKSSTRHLERSNTDCAAYLIFAAAIMPFFVFIVPRILPSLHPDTIINADRAIKLSSEMRLTLAVSTSAFIALSASIFSGMNLFSVKKMSSNEVPDNEIE